MNPTQLVGTIGCAMAALACLSRRDRRWIAPASVFMGMLVDLQLNTRYAVRTAAENFLFAHGLPFAEKRPFQVVVLIVAAIVLVLAIRWFARGKNGLREARLGAILIAALWMIEAISLHATDHIMWAPAGPILLGAWLWLAACALAIWGALFGRRR
ncbi:MAG: hypothetical protein J0I47_04590 [Sphingomonas sp.]|uniref:hypothetical protein n=1 Tax=Sphingomonas sp. TaxID=28214 RepID=UPI001AC41CF0|nr:hypothetical protein [Sphingomonas sp.]MBN8807503.1 hypothetical protein [Sphingomonas sp.]